MADPFTYDHRPGRRYVESEEDKTERESTPPTHAAPIVPKNHFGIVGALVFCYVSPFTASVCQSFLLMIMYNPYFEELGISESSHIFCELVGPWIGYLLAMSYVGGCFGKHIANPKSKLFVFALVGIAQIVHFTVFWMEDVILEDTRFKENLFVYSLIQLVNGEYFVRLVCIFLLRFVVEIDVEFRPENSCVNRCATTCCLCCGRLCIMFLGFVFLVLLAVASEKNFDSSGFNGNFEWNFQSGGGFDVPNFGGNAAGGRITALRTLNLGTSASLRDIKASYRTLAKAYHPDKCGQHGDGMDPKECESKFIKVQESYEYLTGKSAKSVRGKRPKYSRL